MNHYPKHPLYPDSFAFHIGPFVLIDSGNRRITLCGQIDSFMLGEVLYRIMKNAAAEERRHI